MIFYDVAEAQHKQPILGDYWRQAWETVRPEEGDEDEDDGSTQCPAGSASAPEVDADGCSLCPASGGEMSVTPAPEGDSWNEPKRRRRR